MRVALGLAALLGCLACSIEARKLGEVDVSDGFGGFGGFGGSSNVGDTPLGGTPSAAGSSPQSSGGSPTSTIGTGGATGFNGGKLLITEDQRNSLAATSCVRVTFESDSVQLPPQIELVVDVSASMNERTFEYDRFSKWELTRDTLLDAVLGVTGPGLPDWAEVGLLLYPKSGGLAPELSCSDRNGWVLRSPLGEAGSHQRTLIQQRLRDARPSGVTPTLEAYEAALNEGLLANPGVGPGYVLLVTDGTPTLADCVDPNAELPAVDPQPIVQAIGAAFSQHGIKTLVVGTAGSEANRTWLSEAALQGGIVATPGCTVEAGNCHIELTTQSDFGATLNVAVNPIVGQGNPCTFDLPPPPAGATFDLSQINVVLRSTTESWLLLRSTASDCTTGWRLEGNQIHLCPDSCVEAQRASLELLIGCAIVAK